MRPGEDDALADDSHLKAPRIRLRGEVYDRVRFTPESSEERCFDCGSEPGQVHDWGCDAEDCPRCGGQLLSCDCLQDADTAPEEKERLRRLICDDIRREDMEDAVNRAADAFRMRQYAAVIELLSPFEADLSSAARAKLRYARAARPVA